MNNSSVCPRETPFFIVGNPRSGTTLLTYILSSHPRIYIPAETGFLPQLTKYAKESLHEKEVREIIRLIRRNRDWKDLKIDAESYYAGLPVKSLACVLDGLYRLKIKDFKAERWGDKTPSYVQFMGLIDQIFPDAQFIHVIRDGRDSTLSALQKWRNQKWYMDTYYLLSRWLENVKVGREVGKILGPERYLEIKYEDLVRRPQEIIEQICFFLGESFHPNMLDHSKLAKEVIGPGGHTEVRNPINTQSVGRWQNEMSSFDIKIAHTLISEMLNEFGYPPGGGKAFTLWERLKMFGLRLRYSALSVVRKGLYGVGVLVLNRGKYK